MWVSTHQHSMYSLKDSVAKAEDIASKCAKHDMFACAITDHQNLIGVPSFFREMKKKGIKPIAGVEINVCKQHASIQKQENRPYSHLVMLAKNLRGWKDLIKIVTESNKPENFYYSARLSLDQIGELNTSKNIIAFGSHPGATIADELWLDRKACYNANSYEEARACADTANWESRMTREIERHQEVFGKDNFYLESQWIDSERLFMAQILGKAVRHLGKKLGIPCVATADPHYVDKPDVFLQRIALCDGMNAKLSHVESALSRGDEVGMGGFFKSDNYHLPTPDEMKRFHPEEELRNSIEIANQIEEFDLTNPPSLPRFDCPDGLSSDVYLRQICENSFRELGIDKYENYQQYRDRFQLEYDTVTKYHLEDYFLIMSDIIQDIWRRGRITGPSRGSCGGSLLALLSGITYRIDPIEYNLLFERFLNIGRLDGPKKSLPDIDTDVEQEDRANVVSYITNKYGSDCVAHVCTVLAYKGKSALKAVLRAREACTPAEQNEITKLLPSDAAISDSLQDMLEATGDKSVIRLTLEDRGKDFKKWVHLDKDGNYAGDFAPYFATAEKMEFIKNGLSQHASAIVIAAEPIVETCPMIRAKKNESLIVGWEFPDVEAAGIMKGDFLGLSTLDRVRHCIELINERHPGGVL